MVLGHHVALHNYTWKSNDSSLDLVLRYLGAWNTYVDNLSSMVELSSPSQYPAVRQLLGLSVPRKRQRNGHFLHVPNSSWLYDQAVQAQVHVNKKTSRGQNLVAVADMDRLIKHKMPEYLKTRLVTLHLNLIDSSWILPLSDPSPESFVAPPGAGVSVLSFEETIQVFSLAVTALNPVRKLATKVLSGNLNTDIIHTWITRLFSIVFPSTGRVSHLSTLAQLPHKNVSYDSIRVWVDEYLSLLRPSGKYPDSFLTTLIACLSLSYELGNNLGPHFSALQRIKLPCSLQRRGYSDTCTILSKSIVNDLFGLFQLDSFGGIAQSICGLR